MKILLDTHVLIWFVEGDEKLSSKAKSAIENLNNERFVSIVSLWEIAIKRSLNKLEANRSFSEFADLLAQNDIWVVNVEINHLNTLLTLPFHHKDPFDRLIIAQVIAEGMTLVSIDGQFEAYPVNTIQ